ncbi:MAG: hypothetical protein J07HB67_01759 [halophilic archaeon J07HB67]|nr:MAG: hypothetical protein J07HB67_01759 [halophilic archaeon J07HB67]
MTKIYTSLATLYRYGRSRATGDVRGDNEAVGEEWEAETTPYERVRRVVARAYSPLSADEVADGARTSPKTARKHLEALAREGFVTTEPADHGATAYRRSSESLVVEQAADILDSVSTDDLAERVREMRDRLADYRTTFGVESPEELTVDRTNRALGADSSPETPDPETIREWKTLRRNLAFANAALSIGHAESFVETDRSDADSRDDISA